MDDFHDITPERYRCIPILGQCPGVKRRDDGMLRVKGKLPDGNEVEVEIHESYFADLEMNSPITPPSA